MNCTSSPLRLLFNRWSLQLAATVGLVVFALGSVDLGESWHALLDANYAWAGLALAILTAIKVIAAIRWRLYLTKVGRPPLLGLMGAYIVGTMVNTVLPFRAGDFTKVEIVASRYHLPRAALSSTVFTVEAVLEVVTLLILFLVSLLILDLSLVPDFVIYLLIVVAGGGFVAAVLTSRFLPHEMPSRWPLTRLSPRARLILSDAWPRFLDGMVTLRDRDLFTRALSLHFAEWLMRAGALWVLAFGFSLNEGPVTFVLVVMAVSLATFLPVTFLNFGTYQVVVTEVLVASGSPRDDAFAYAVAAHALTQGWVLVTGIVAMVLMQLTRGRAAATSGQDSDEAAREERQPEALDHGQAIDGAHGKVEHSEHEVDHEGAGEHPEGHV